MIQKGKAADELASRIRQYNLARRPTDAVISSPKYIPDDDLKDGSFADVEAVVGSVEWLVRDWVPLRMTSGTIAPPKTGKSAYVLGGLIAPLVTGGTFWNGVKVPRPRNVVYVDTERSLPLIIQRAKAWNIPLDRIKVPFPEDLLLPFSLEDPAHLGRLRDVICKHDCPLVVVDSFRGSHDGDENNSKIAKPLRDLGGVAEETGAAIHIVHHTKKLAIGEDLTPDCGRGSNAFLAAVRCQLAIDLPDPKSPWRRLQVLGSNLSLPPAPVGFRFDEGGLEFGEAPTRPPREGETTKAAEWLRQRMKPGEAHDVNELISEGEALGISKRTLQRVANDTLGVTAEAVREKGRIKGWRWRLREGG